MGNVWSIVRTLHFLKKLSRTQVGLAARQAGLLWSLRKLVLGLGELTELQGNAPKWAHQFVHSEDILREVWTVVCLCGSIGVRLCAGRMPAGV